METNEMSPVVTLSFTSEHFPDCSTGLDEGSRLSELRRQRSEFKASKVVRICGAGYWREEWCAEKLKEAI